MTTQTYDLTDEQKAALGNTVAALRSGKYNQAQGVLRDCNRFCCLGVHADLLPGRKWERPTETGAYTCELDGHHFSTSLGREHLPLDLTDDMIEWNDSKCLSFAQIADKLEKIINV